MNDLTIACPSEMSCADRATRAIVRRDVVQSPPASGRARIRPRRWFVAAGLLLVTIVGVVPTQAWVAVRGQARRVPFFSGVEGRLLRGARALRGLVGLQPAYQPVVAADPALRAGRYAINVGINADWSTAGAWVDARNSLRRWGMPDRPWVEKPNLKLSADGYPLSDAGTLSYLHGYPDGAYHLSYRGTGEVSAGGMGRIAGAITTTGGLHSGVVTIDHATHDLLTLAVTKTDATDPIRDLRLIRPGYAANTRRVFADPYLRRLRPFSTIRVMEWSGVNTANVREWSERVSPSSFLRTGPGGVAYEDLAALANESGKDLWITVPDGATDDHVTRLAQLLKARLEPDRGVVLELGNELWNGSFPQARRLIAAARADAELSRSDDFGRAGEKAAKRLAEIATIFRNELGSGKTRVIPILCGQSANTYFLECGLEYLSKHRGEPNKTIDAIAIAPYLFLPAELDKPGLTRDALFAGLDAFAEAKLKPWIRDHGSLAARYGLPLVSYEGGQHLTPWNAEDRLDVNEVVKRDAQIDPRMGDLYVRFDREWAAHGGGLFTFYALTSAYGPGGYWGLLSDDTQAGSVKWDAVLSLALVPGDATLDGNVDFADFRVISAHFGQKPCWREQGDLNRDRVVDRADLRIFQEAAKGLTPAERQAIEEFASKAGR